MIFNTDHPYILSFDYENNKMINLTAFNTFFISFNINGSSLDDEKIEIYYPNIKECENEIKLINKKLILAKKIMDEEIAEFEKKI